VKVICGNPADDGLVQRWLAFFGLAA